MLASCTAGVMAGGVLLEVASAPVQRINSKRNCRHQLSACTTVHAGVPILFLDATYPWHLKPALGPLVLPT